MANRSVPRRAPVAAAAALAVAVAAACAAPAPSGTPIPPPTPTSVPTAAGATPAPTGLPAGPAPGPAAFADAPSACLGLDPGPCDQVRAAVADLATGLQVLYVEIGPFGCAVAAPCPRTLDARPTGEVLIETAGEGQPIGATVRWDGTKVAVAPAPAFQVVVPPQSARAVVGVVPFDLGHCGIFSGIDLDGSWWDPVGFVDTDHPDSINSARAVVTALDDAHAALRTTGGLALQLVRRSGPKALRPCM